MCERERENLKKKKKQHSSLVPAASNSYQTGHKTHTLGICYKQLIKISHENITDYVHIF